MLVAPSPGRGPDETAGRIISARSIVCRSSGDALSGKDQIVFPMRIFEMPPVSTEGPLVRAAARVSEFTVGGIWENHAARVPKFNTSDGKPFVTITPRDITIA